jgi:hypothetical protein
VGVLAESMDYFLAIGYVSLWLRYVGSTPSLPFYIGIEDTPIPLLWPQLVGGAQVVALTCLSRHALETNLSAFYNFSTDRYI